MNESNHNVMGMDIMTMVAMIFIFVAIVSTHTTMQMTLTNFESLQTEKDTDPGAQDPKETAVVYFRLHENTQAPVIRFRGEGEEQVLSYPELIETLRVERPSAVTIFTDKRYPAEHFGSLLLDASQMNIRIQLGATP